MNFLPKSICEKLVAMGCKSAHTEYYLGSDHSNFTPWDFVGTSEQARENARILWGMNPGHQVNQKEKEGEVTINWNLRHQRHACIDSPDAAQYIIAAVEKHEL